MPYNYAEILAWEWAGNSVARITAAAGLFLVLIILFRGILPFILRKLDIAARKSAIQADNLAIETLLDVPPAAYIFLAFVLAARTLILPPPLPIILHASALVVVVSIGIVLIQRVLESVIADEIPQLRESDDGGLPPVLRVTVALVLWSVGVLLVLSNIGINVISLVAGLGIGGIAIALAVQNILGDMFSSFALYFDQPFKVGDFIVVGENMGTVKKVGLKTTRIQALQGEEVVISNQELTSSRIQNFKRMNQRRVAFQFGVTYDTPPEKLEAIPAVVEEIIKASGKTRFDRAHLFRFGESSLDFEVVFYVLSSDYNMYMDLRQSIYLALIRRLQEDGIRFAFPTRTVYTASI